MTQQVFDEIIGDPPPSQVDVDQIIWRERRRRRSTVAGVAGMGAVLAITGVTLAVGAVGVSRPDPVSDLASAAPTVTAPTPTAPTAEQILAVEARLSSALPRAVRRAAPRAVLIGLWGSPPLHAPRFPVYEPPKRVEKERKLVPGAEGYVAVADVRVGQRPGHLNIQISRGAADYADCGTLAAHACEETSGPRGTRVLAYAFPRHNGVTVRAVHPDGLMVVVLLMGVPPNLKPGAERVKLPLSIAQLKAIALDPAVVI